VNDFNTLAVLNKTLMKTYPTFQASVDREIDDEPQTRVLWFADGTSVSAHILKVEATGIHITSPSKSGFIAASELCTIDRVRFGFGSRKETEWAARIQANEAKQKSAGLAVALQS
jgi:hypothetical protein